MFASNFSGVFDDFFEDLGDFLVALRALFEDLAELAGERGAVSVQQQLRIIARMCRTYSFLKVISSGISFSTNAASTIC